MRKINSFDEGRLKDLLNTKIENYLDPLLTNLLGELTRKYNIEISLLLDNHNKVIEYQIGDFKSVKVSIPEFHPSKINQFKIIHTHPNNAPYFSLLDAKTADKLNLSIIIALAVSQVGIIEKYAIGIGTIENNTYSLLKFENQKIINYNQAMIEKLINENKTLKINNYTNYSQFKNLIINFNNDANNIEIIELAKACNLEKNLISTVSLKKINPSSFLNSGKIEELNETIKLNNIELVVIDCELSSIQHKNLSDLWGVSVFDRKSLIIEIFKRRAKTKEAKLQVLIAELKQKQTRLKGQGINLSRIGGGLKSKGAGEQKLELDRRQIKETIFFYEQELLNIKKVKNNQSKKRNNSNIPSFSLVGYTNVGKSTLMNCFIELSIKNKQLLENKSVFAENMLFATLDTTIREIVLPSQVKFLLSDTIGFIQNLPHDLIESFKTTLIEATTSDYIIHLIDISDPNYSIKKATVGSILNDLDVPKNNIIEVYNKVDQNFSNQIDDNAIKISAKTNNLKMLITKIEKIILDNYKTYYLKLSYQQVKSINKIYLLAIVTSINYEESFIAITIKATPLNYQKICYLLKKENYNS